ncbi:MAG: DUF2993 domain-containing protein [Synergistaceae bacterium]|nr:DUF2993 domain-containing protein [Synergistaceae bacterium]
MKRLLLSVILIAALALPSAARTREFAGDFTPETNGEKLLSILVSVTNPEALELRLDEEPDDQGNIRNLHVLVKGANLGGFRVEKLALESSFLELAPPSEWDADAKDPIKVKEALRTNFETVILEKDINAALSARGGDEWRKVSVDLKPGFLTARGYYHVKNPGLTLLAEVKTGLEIKKGKELWLKDTELKINHDEQTDVVRDAIRDLQPLVDIRDLPFPITLAELKVTDSSLRMATRTAPKPFEGLLLRYTKK